MSSDNAKPVVSPVLRGLIDSGQIQVYTHEDLSAAMNMAPADIVSMQRELTRLRSENERLRKVADLARMYRELGQQIINGGVWGFDEDVRDKYLHTRHVLDRALAALDQERKEGE